MTLANEVFALRRSVGLSLPDHIAIVEVGGRDALELLQLACTQSPFVRLGRVRHTLLLRDDGSVFADAFVVSLGDCFLVLAEGPSESELAAWLAALASRAPEKVVTVRSMSDEWAVIGVDGPYAWELVSRLLGPAVVGMPYLTLMTRDETLCVRAGKTGEYGYLLLVPRSARESVRSELVSYGAPLDLVPVGLEALDVCALEGWHFSMRSLGKAEWATTLTPLELQLQWRVGHAREFVGADALRARKAEGQRLRLTCFTAPSPVLPGMRLVLGTEDVGEVLVAASSPTLGRTVGGALIAKPFAHPHLDLSAVGSEGSVPVRTCTAYLVDNESLRVAPHHGHSYANRGERS